MVQGAGGEGHGSDAPGAATDERGEAGEPDGGALAGGTATITAKPLAPRTAPPGPGAPAASPPARRPGWRRLIRGPGRALATGQAGRHLALLACYITVGIAVTWPRATYLVDGKLEATRDAGVYVWDFCCLLYTSPSPRD